MRLSLVAALLALFLLGGCSGSDEEDSTPPQGTTSGESATQTQPSTATEPPASVVAGPPGPILEQFVAAARVGDLDDMWDLLSTATQERLGPTPAEFEQGRGSKLAKRLEGFQEGRSAIFLEEQVSAEFAVAAFGGRRVLKGRLVRDAYAVALRFEDGGWKIELGGPVKLEALVPDPGEVENQNAQVAAGVTADAAILEGGLWLDGDAVPGESGGTDDRNITFFSDPVTELEDGPHAAVAFANTGDDASALAWLFTVRRN